MSTTPNPASASRAPGASYVLECASDEGKPVLVMGQGLPNEIDGQPVFYRRKEIARAGHYVHRGRPIKDASGHPVLDASGEPMYDQFDITPQRIDGWVDAFRRRRDAGIRPFVPERHVTGQTDARANFGYIVDAERKGDSLYGTFQLIGNEALSAAARNDVSVYVIADAADAKGGRYDECIEHVCLTPNPVIPDLEPFMKIAASADGGAARDVPVFVLALADDADGHWVTIDGEHVFIGKGGTVEKGPSSLKGKSLGDATRAASAEHVIHTANASGIGLSKDEIGKLREGHAATHASVQEKIENQYPDRKVPTNVSDYAERSARANDVIRQAGNSGVPLTSDDIQKLRAGDKGAHEKIGNKIKNQWPGGRVPTGLSADSHTALKPRRHKMKAELAQQVRAKFGFGADVPDDQIDDKAAEKALALSADVDTLTTERDAKAQEVLALSADKKWEPDPLSLSLVTKAFRGEEERLIAKGRISEAGIGELRKLYFADGRPTRAALALSAGGTDPHYSRVLQVVEKFPGMAASNAPRPGERVAEPLSLSADGKEPEKPLTDEEKAKLLGQRAVHTTHVL